jgi:hypothetical protein
MTQPEVIATRLLKLEQQIIAYQKLHEDEYSELLLAVNSMKQDIAAHYEENNTKPNSINIKERKEQKPTE